MKDYYYILGLKNSSSAEEVKKAYRKLSLKFHPDKNDGDEFFTERFKEIQEAYEVLSNESKRKSYDALKHKSSSEGKNDGSKSNNGPNFTPEIEYFRSNKQSFEYDEEVTFSWKTINADNVTLRPFGIVQPIGQKTYKIKDFKNSSISFELIAENSNIGRRTGSSLVLMNKTNSYLFEHFRNKINKDNSEKNDKTTQNANDEINNDSENKDGYLKYLFIFNGALVLALFIYIIWLNGQF